MKCCTFTEISIITAMTGSEYNGWGNFEFFFIEHMLGFKPDFSQAELDFIPLPDPFTGPNSKAILNSFEQGQNGMNSNLNVTTKDRQVISAYLTTCLGIHFEDVKQLKSLEILREMVAS